jgi:hypothetical protein
MHDHSNWLDSPQIRDNIAQREHHRRVVERARRDMQRIEKNPRTKTEPEFKG